jgi:hypothetical protein
VRSRLSPPLRPCHDHHRGDNNGEISFGALQAGLDLSYSPSIVFFTWAGCDEMDEVTDDGHAELLDYGSIEITLAYHNSDEAILKATRDYFFNSLLGGPSNRTLSPEVAARAKSLEQSAPRAWLGLSVLELQFLVQVRCSESE